MPIRNPSQYQCNNIEKFDKIVITHRSLIYRVIRHYFMKDKIKVKMVDEKDICHTYYQEDITIIQEYEQACTQVTEDIVPFNVDSYLIRHTSSFKSIIATLDYLTLVFNSRYNDYISYQTYRENDTEK